MDDDHSEVALNGAARSPIDFATILAANREYAKDFRFSGLTGKAQRGLAVLTCIDSRIEPLEMMGLVPGDAKIIRNAGARVTDDALRSLTLAVHLLDVERIMIMAHTRCAMHQPEEELHQRIRESGAPPGASEIYLHAVSDAHASLHFDIERLRTSGLIPESVEVGGFIYDVTTGLLEQVVR